VTKSGQIGTRGETGVCKFLAENGFPLAERRRLRGNVDGGDLVTVPGLVIEVKSGAAAKNASLALIDAWLAETETERVNAGADIGVLVIQRRGYAPTRAGHWRAIVSINDLGGALPLGFPVEMQLQHAARWLRTLGFGEPLADDINDGQAGAA
jgi:hypothetical protein